MKLLNLQFSIFGSFFEIGNEKTNTEELQTILGSGYFINHLPVINAGANPPEQLIRIRVIGTDENQGIDIGFLPNRIDLNFTSDAYKKKSLEAGQSYDVRELTEKFRKIAYKISDHYKLIGTRLAVNGRIITTEISSDYSEYIKASDFAPHVDDLCMAMTVMNEDSLFASRLARVIPLALLVPGYQTGIAQEH